MDGSPPPEDKNKKLIEKMEDEFNCSITTEPMIDPVILSDGHTYERAAIERWLIHRNTSPLTRERLNGDVIPNLFAKKIINEWRQANGIEIETGAAATRNADLMDAAAAAAAAPAVARPPGQPQVSAIRGVWNTFKESQPPDAQVIDQDNPVFELGSAGGDNYTERITLDSDDLHQGQSISFISSNGPADEVHATNEGELSIENIDARVVDNDTFSVRVYATGTVYNRRTGLGIVYNSQDPLLLFTIKYNKPGSHRVTQGPEHWSIDYHDFEEFLSFYFEDSF